jgi:NAD(P)-dependent dehydrogenase (short-subunit alcohol dehydrogenase family)
MASVFEMLRMDGKVSIITGGHAWLGYDMACALAEAGSNIIITSRNAENIQSVTEEIAKTYGVKTLAIGMNQTNYSEVEKMAMTAYSWRGNIDVLINNAGGGSGASEGNLFEREPESIGNMIDINLTGMLYCCRAIGKYMMERKSGKIINMASIAAIIGRNRDMYRQNNIMEQPVDYAAAKSGVLGATRDLAALMSPYGICVNAISPGGFDKGNLTGEFLKAYSAETPLGRMGRMGVDLKGAALLLASSAGDYITGQNIVVDGGFSIWK